MEGQEVILSGGTVVAPSGIPALMNTAIQSGMGAEGLEKLFSLYERQRDHDAKMAYSAAMAEFQNEAPVIPKNRTVNTGKYSYDYAELDHIAETIRPILYRHGLSYRYNSDLGDKTIKVDCIVTHAQGHSETTSFACPLGGMAGINAAQQTASALSYARRYALLLALGLSTGEQDDDMAGVLNEAQVAAVESLLDKTQADRGKFFAWLQVETVDQIPSDRFQPAIDALLRKLKDKQKAEVVTSQNGGEVD